MPKICEFLGISIYIYYREHFPPHFHALYGGSEILIAIDNFSVVSGHLSPRVTGLVIEWATQHQKELMQIWKQAEAHQPLDKIEPLK